MAGRADYLLHHIVAEDISLLALAVLHHFLPWGWALLSANLAAALALVLKGVYDYFHPDTHSVEMMDLQSGLLSLAFLDIVAVILFISF